MIIYNHGRHSVIIHIDDYNPESPAPPVRSIEKPSLRKLPKTRCAKQAQEREDFDKKEFKVQARKYFLKND